MANYKETMNRGYNIAGHNMRNSEGSKEEAEKIKLAKRAEDAKAVEAALKKANEAQKEADELLRTFVKKYGSFHATFDKDMYPMRWTDVFDLFFNI